MHGVVTLGVNFTEITTQSTAAERNPILKMVPVESDVPAAI